MRKGGPHSVSHRRVSKASRSLPKRHRGKAHTTFGKSDVKQDASGADRRLFRSGLLAGIVPHGLPAAAPVVLKGHGYLHDHVGCCSDAHHHLPPQLCRSPRGPFVSATHGWRVYLLSFCDIEEYARDTCTPPFCNW